MNVDILSSLPTFRLYWLQTKYSSIPPFCVLHFYKDIQTSIHPFLSQLLSMKNCQVIQQGQSPLLFVYLPTEYLQNKSIHYFLSNIPSERIISIPYSQTTCDLLK